MRLQRNRGHFRRFERVREARWGSPPAWSAAPFLTASLTCSARVSAEDQASMRSRSRFALPETMKSFRGATSEPMSSSNTSSAR